MYFSFWYFFLYVLKKLIVISNVQLRRELLLFDNDIQRQHKNVVDILI